jgi:hypothetical protein
MKQPSSMADEIPTTEQGMKTYKAYAVAEIKRMQLAIRRLDRAVETIEERLAKIKESKKDGSKISN